MTIARALTRLGYYTSETYRGVDPHIPAGRLTLASGTPVMNTEQAAKITIYYTPYKGDLIPMYNGAWADLTFAEMSLALDADSGHTGYHQSGKLFDLFVYDDAGTMRLVSGPAWTSDTARATALEYVNGILMNAASMTARFGSASGNTVTVAQNRCTYVGTFYASAGGTTTHELGGQAANGDEGKICVWNAYNRVPLSISVRDSTGSWTYNSTTIRAMHGSNTNRVSFARGLNEDGVNAVLNIPISGGASGDTMIGVTLDATNAADQNMPYGSFGTAVAPAVAVWGGLPGLGWHYLQAIEVQITTASAASFFGQVGSKQTMNYVVNLVY